MNTQTNTQVKINKTYLANGFSPSMLNLSTPMNIRFSRVNIEEFCSEINEAIRGNSLINAIGHKATVSLVNSLCGTNLTENRISITINSAEEVLIVTVSERLPEGKILSEEEIKALLQQGKILFIRAEAMGST